MSRALGLSGASGGAHKYTLKLELKPTEIRDPIHYKHDGGRFEAAQETVKIITGLTYIISVSCTPDLTIMGCELSGEGDWQDEELEFYTSAAPTPSRSQQLPDTTQPNTDTPTPTPTPQPTNTATTITPATTAIQPSSEPQKAPLIDLLSDDIPMTTATHIQQGVSTSTAANGSTAHTAETDLAATGLQVQANGSDKAAAPATAAGVPVQTTGQAPQTSQQGDDSGQGDKEGKKGPPESVASRDKPVCWEWDCRWPKSKHGQRTLTKLKIATKELGLVELPVLVKVYRERSKHKRIGFALNYIQYLLVPHPVMDRQAKVVGTSFFSLGSA